MSQSTKKNTAKGKGNTRPIRRKEDVQHSNDERIDEDFPGYPNPPSKPPSDAPTHNGSANAFEATENPRDDE